MTSEREKIIICFVDLWGNQKTCITLKCTSFDQRITINDRNTHIDKKKPIDIFLKEIWHFKLIFPKFRFFFTAPYFFVIEVSTR